APTSARNASAKPVRSGWYVIVRSTRVAVGDNGKKRMRPLALTGEFGTLSHAITELGTYLVTVASHSTEWPVGERTAQCDRPSCESSMLRIVSVICGKFSKSRANSNTSLIGR